MPHPEPSLAAALKKIGWTSGELADRLGVSPDTTSQWVRNRRTPPDTLLPWLDAVGLGVEGAGASPPGWETVRPGRRLTP